MTPRWITTKETPVRIAYATDASEAARKLGVAVDQVALAGVYDPTRNEVVGEGGVLVYGAFNHVVGITTIPKPNGVHAPNGVPYLNGAAK